MPSTPIDVLRTPLPPLDLADAHAFEQIELRGISLAVDAIAQSRIKAARQVGSDESAASAIPYLIEMMGQDRITSSPSSDVLVAAFTGGSPTRDDGRAAENMAYIGEADLACHVVAQDVLASMGTTAVPALVETLRSANVNQRIGAAKTLGSIGNAAQAALPILKELSKDSSENVRTAAADAIKKIKPKGWSLF